MPSWPARKGISTVTGGFKPALTGPDLSPWREELEAAGEKPDDAFPFRTALVCFLAALSGRDKNAADAAHAVWGDWGQAVEARVKTLHAAGAGDDVQTLLAGLKYAFFEDYRFAMLAPAGTLVAAPDLIEGLKNREMTPLDAAVLVYGAGRSRGWPVAPADFPGRPLLVFAGENARIFADPAHHFRPLDAGELRSFVKEQAGAEAELSQDYYRTLNARETAIRYGNALKTALLQQGATPRAYACVRAMQFLAPGEYRLNYDAALLAAQLGQRDAALEALQAYRTRAPNAREVQEMEHLVHSFLARNA